VPPIKIPQNWIAGLPDDRLQIGSVFKTMVYDTNKPKEKYFVVVAESIDSISLASVYINSEINPNLFRTAKLKELHIPISKQDCTFLKWDSFVDCSQLHEKNKIQLSTLLNELNISPYMGTMPIEIFNRILNKLIHTNTIPILTKKRYGLIK